MSQKILDMFGEAILESLNYWTKIASGFHIAADVIPLTVYRVVKLINVRMDAFRKELKVLYETYKEMEQQYDLEPLSLAYFEEYSSVTSSLQKKINEIKEIAEKYAEVIDTIQKTEKGNIDINKYISAHNQKAIERLSQIDLETLLAILADAHLLGF